MDFLRTLAYHVSDDDEFVVIHSSLFPFRLGEEELKWPLLRSINRLAKRGHTVLVPSFTFSFTKTGRFEPRETRSEVGLLGDWLCELTEARRTRHPIYSFAVLGSRASEIVDIQTETCFTENSIFGFLDRHRTRLIMFGCGWEYCTQFHYYEAESQAPYRFEKVFNSYDGCSKTSMYVRDLDVNPRNDFLSVIDALRAADKVSKSELKGVSIEGVSCADLAGEARARLADDPYAFVRSPRRVRYLIEQKQERVTNSSVRVSLFGEANLDLLGKALEENCANCVTHRRVEVTVPPFGQYRHQIHDPTSAFGKKPPDAVFFLNRFEDVFRTPYPETASKGPLEAFEEYASTIQAVAMRSIRVFVLTFAMTRSPLLGTADAVADEGLSALINDCNRQLRDLARESSNVALIELQPLAARSTGPMSDERLWHLGRIPFSDAFADLLSARMIAAIIALTGKAVRMLAVDLDQTLWGGVLGEDGIEGVALGGDYPGSCFSQFQKTIRALMDRGIAVAILSKNDEDLALKAIAELPDMSFREPDLAAHCINWNDKASNLYAIAEEVNLSPEHILFIDDNPVERERMRVNCPEARVLDLPDDPTQYSTALLNCQWLDLLEFTQEDSKRTRAYAGRRHMNSAMSEFDTIESFFMTLGMKVTVATVGDNNRSRVLQLLEKTNQFNATTRRHTSNDLARLQEEGSAVLVFGLEDKFTDFENIGVMILVHAEVDVHIDSFLLSCRVLGRGVETAMLACAVKWAHKHGYQRVIGEVLPTKLNSPVRDVFQRHGFSPYAEHGFWVRDTQETLDVPRWIKLDEQAWRLK